ncbi:hypothetical protein GQ55_4G183600 [Panicum hallii var. hallii]|uniref:Uncharacterized protein n=1 Tax=Panicum hallii var. hallii TaxID=1504633 RepID=A0A2T7DYW8_9POAL|nr:hypothetical protein GQ55_4G183600 [Panicum hallii var. hallii]
MLRTGALQVTRPSPPNLHSLLAASPLPSLPGPSPRPGRSSVPHEAPSRPPPCAPRGACPASRRPAPREAPSRLSPCTPSQTSSTPPPAPGGRRSAWTSHSVA